jgi:hypothetical protein
MLCHMRKKPSPAGRPGKRGVRFRLILKRLLHISNSVGHRHRLLRASRKVAGENWSLAVLIAGALPGSKHKSEFKGGTSLCS